MDLRFSQFEILTAAGAFFLCLAFVCVLSEASDIEEEIGAQVLEAVRQQNLFWASVEPRGQSVLLTGAAPDYQAKHRAGEIAASVPGVAGVENEIAIIGEAGTCQEESAELNDSSYPILDMLASIARNCGVRLEIAAHTDAVGDASINLKLSQRRADEVRRYLVRSGVAAEQVAARGYGETQPIADNGTAEGREANRRIEFRVLGGAS